MSAETLSLAVDLLFAGMGVAVVVLGWLQRREPPMAERAPGVSSLELGLTAAALLVAAIGPNVLIVALTPGMPEMPTLATYALLPSLVLFALVWVVAARLGQARLANRLWVGLWTGAASSGVLDAIRLTGFHLGWMPGNMPRMFGVLILDRMAAGPTFGSDVLGYLYHYWVGACFGLAYTLLAGRVRWWGGVIWGLIIEVGMMVTPPMVVAMDTGYFGVKFGPGLFGTSLTAHVAFGAALGLLAERYVRHRGTLPALLGAWWRGLEIPPSSADLLKLR
ncbi:MAG: hypothetical protein HYZ89_02085 [Candidatus Omnitrophica bacterium]|nr:hypothetical protein [Candidatus Omnitrophota bacterium]